MEITTEQKIAIIEAGIGRKLEKWQIEFIMAHLSAAARDLENAILNGTGNQMPVGIAGRKAEHEFGTTTFLPRRQQPIKHQRPFKEKKGKRW